MLNTPIKPMLLQPSTEIPKSNKYIHQLKLDGHRALLHYDRGNIKIFTRHLNEATYKYPELQTIKLPVTNCILDGELICFDREEDHPKPCFDSLMVRLQTSNQSKIMELKDKLPVHFSAFDVLYLNGVPQINKMQQWMSQTNVQKTNQQLNASMSETKAIQQLITLINEIQGMMNRGEWDSDKMEQTVDQLGTLIYNTEGKFETALINAQQQAITVLAMSQQAMFQSQAFSEICHIFQMSSMMLQNMKKMGMTH